MKKGNLFVPSSLAVIFSVSLIFAENFSSGSRPEDSFDYLEPLKLPLLEKNLFSQDEIVPDKNVQRNEDESTEKQMTLPDIEDTWTIIKNLTNVTTNNQNPLFPAATSTSSKQSITGNESSVLPKRHIIRSLVDELPETDSIYEEPDPCPSAWEQLRSSSCELEASEFGHHRVTGLIVHEMFCETTKLLRYILVAAQNLRSELGLELLFDLEGEGEHLITLKRLLSDENLRQKIIRGLMRLKTFFHSPENLEYLSAIVERCVPFVHIQENWGRLKVAVDNFFVHIVRFLQQLDHRFSLTNINADLLLKLRDEIISVQKETLHLIREYLSNPFGGSAVSFVESLFDRLFARERFHPYLAVLKELADVLRDFYSGYHASGFQQHIIAPTGSFVSNFLADFFPDERILNNGQDLSASIISSASPWFSFIWKKLHEIPSSSSFSPSDINLMDTATDTETSNELVANDSDVTSDFLSKIEPTLATEDSANVFPISSDYSIDSSDIPTEAISNAFTADSLSSPTSTTSSGASSVLTPNTYPDNNSPPLPTISALLEAASKTDNLQSSSPSMETESFIATTPATNDASLSYPTSNKGVFNNFPFPMTELNYLPSATFKTDSPSSTADTTFPPRLENIVVPSTNTLPSGSLPNAPQPPLISLDELPDNVPEHPTIPFQLNPTRDALTRTNCNGHPDYYTVPFSGRAAPFYLQPDYPPLSEAYIKFLEYANRLYNDLYGYPRYPNPAVMPSLNLLDKILNSRGLDVLPLLPLFENTGSCGTWKPLPSR